MKIARTERASSRGTRERDNRNFPVVSEVWHPPLVHVAAHPRVFCHLPFLWALNKSLRSPSRQGGAQALYTIVLWAFTISLASSENAPRSPSPPRCCQSPRVTSRRSSLDLDPHQDGCTQALTLILLSKDEFVSGCCKELKHKSSLSV